MTISNHCVLCTITYRRFPDGKLQGAVVGGGSHSIEFLGIPFAAPPVRCVRAIPARLAAATPSSHCAPYGTTRTLIPSGGRHAMEGARRGQELDGHSSGDCVPAQLCPATQPVVQPHV